MIPVLAAVHIFRIVALSALPRHNLIVEQTAFLGRDEKLSFWFPFQRMGLIRQSF